MKKAITIALLFLFVAGAYAQDNTTGNFQWILKNGWKMQSSLTATANGEQISQQNFSTAGWYDVNVPTTIIAGLLANKVYDFDPFFAKNLEKITGPQFDKPWWFRKEFSLPASEKNKTVSIRLHGINYKATVWLNGVLISDTTTMKGPFRFFEFDVTKQIKYDGANVLAIEVTRPFNPQKREGDLAIDYADWIHYPADYNGGIVNDIVVNTCDKVAVSHPLVITKFDLPSLSVAHLQVDAEVINYSNEEADVRVKGKINDDINFEQKVHLTPGETKDITFTPDAYPQLNVKNPRIWWPWQYGKPELNRVKLELVRNNKVSNAVVENFGIRQITSTLINNASREFIINGKPIMLRGAAWSPDIFQRRSPERQEQEIKLVRDMNMNIIRSEGKLEDDNFYALCDKYGMLVMTGWMCCGAWQYPDKWDTTKRNVAIESARSVMYWLRNKACILIWLNGSDMPPRDTSVERDWLSIEADLKWPNPIISTADESKSKVSGYSGVKMNGPYDWVPPIYWETDTGKLGGAWSFATEISPGPSIPPYESLIKFIHKDSLWYTNSEWLYHCGTMQFRNTKIFNDALDNRYGKSSTIKEFIAKAQAQNYEGHRAMMEAYGLNKYNTATGVVQWMLSNPWPSIIWHTYDYYLYPAGTYFGMKKSLEPLHVQYSYKSKEVIINNSLLEKFYDLKVKADVYNPDGSLKYSNSITTEADQDAVKRCFAIPEIEGLADTYFLRLQLNDEKGKTVSINWYWLSKKNDELNWNKSDWFYTPEKDYTDFSALQKMPSTALKINYTTGKQETRTMHKITVTNTGKAVAFFVHLRALKSKGSDDILPVIFEDNYLLLAPGEARTIDCSYENKDAGNATPYIAACAWNLDTENSIAGKDAGFINEMK
jgi:exo-1,4-beta-D-glucosaminidase